MRGFLWAVIAAFVAAGRSSLPAHSTGSPDLAAHAAAGSASSGRSLGATITCWDGVPDALICAASIAGAIAAGSAPAITVDLEPSGAGAEPIRITWAPPAF